MLSAIAALALALSVVPAASAYTPGTSSDFFGVNASYLRFLVPDQNSRVEAIATSMGQQGISWARVTFDQSVEERTRGVFTWQVPDTIVAALARHGVRTDAMFVGTASWDADPVLLGTCGPRAAPNDVGGWEEWVGAAAQRYGPGGTFWAAHPELPQLPIQRWEIGNEPNLHIYWCPKVDPYMYAQVYSRSQKAITAVDPAAKVATGGLAPNFNFPKRNDQEPKDFLGGVIASIPSLRTSISEVGIHTYSQTIDGSLGVIAQFRQVLTNLGMPTTPLLADEFGWHTFGTVDPYIATEDQRVNLIGGTANTYWRTNCGVSGMAPYSWASPEANMNDPENWYGLVDPYSGVPHPSGYAYGQQIALALGRGSSAPPTTVLNLCPSTAPPPDPQPAPDPQPSPSPSPSPGPIGSIGNLLGASAQQSTSSSTTTSTSAKKKCRKGKKKRRRCHRRHRHHH